MPVNPNTTHGAGLPDSATKSLTINAAFFEEVKEAHAEVLAVINQIQQLEQGGCHTDSASLALTEQLERLFDLIGLYFALEEAYGYFEDPVFVGAAYSKRVSDLRAEHGNLSSELGRLCDHASRLYYHGRMPEAAQTVLARFRVFCDQLAQHEVRERDLISEAFTVDIGCGD